MWVLIDLPTLKRSDMLNRLIIINFISVHRMPWNRLIWFFLLYQQRIVKVSISCRRSLNRNVHNRVRLDHSPAWSLSHSKKFDCRSSNTNCLYDFRFDQLAVLTENDAREFEATFRIPVYLFSSVYSNMRQATFFLNMIAENLYQRRWTSNENSSYWLFCTIDHTELNPSIAM